MKYIAKEFPGSIGKIQQHWLPRGRKLSDRWLAEVAEKGPLLVKGNIPSSRITAAHVRSLIGGIRGKELTFPVAKLENKMQEFPTWLALALKKNSSSRLYKLMEQNFRLAHSLVEALHETELITALQQGGATPRQKELLGKLSNVSHPIEAIGLYMALAATHQSIHETIVAHVEWMHQQETFVWHSRGKSAFFVINCTPAKVIYTFTPGDAFTERQYRELSAFLKDASSLMVDQLPNLLTFPLSVKEKIWKSMRLKQSTIVTWNNDGTYQVWYGRYSWNSKGSIVKAIASAYGLLQIDHVAPIEETSENGQIAQSNLTTLELAQGVYSELKKHAPRDASETKQGKFTIAQTSQDSPILETSIFTHRADVQESGISLTFEDKERVAFWMVGPPPGAGDTQPS